MQDRAFKDRQKCDFDRNHAVHPLPLLTEGSDVWVTMKDGIQVPGVVTEHADTPRSYVVNTEEGGQVRRNRLHLKVVLMTYRPNQG